MKPIDLMTLGGKPINRNAWNVLKPGEHYDPRNVKYGHLVFDVPPPPPGFQKSLNSADLAGEKVGRLTVMFYWARSKNSNGAACQKWACRCICGTYVIRSAKAIKEKNNPNDKCERCRKLEMLKAQDRHRQRKYMGATLWDERNLKAAADAASKDVIDSLRMRDTPANPTDPRSQSGAAAKSAGGQE